jgi:hypothetical protein
MTRARVEAVGSTNSAMVEASRILTLDEVRAKIAALRERLEGLLVRL